MSATQERALSLLGAGFPPSVVASSIGTSESYISQCMSLDWFAAQVQELKFLNLQKHTELDAMYDDLEEKLVKKLDKLVPLLVKPMDITRVLQTVNSAKRRGAGASDLGTVTQNIIQLTLPPALLQRFIKNTNNQIVEVQDGTGQHNSLVTTSSGSLERLSREIRETEELRSSYGSGIESGMEPQKTISPEALEKLADSKTLIKRLNESGRTAAALTAEDL
jgi:hypothetical protein